MRKISVSRRKSHERHKLAALSWLRASVLGANDGIVSISSLILGIAAARASHADILLSGVAALVAGAMSMAVGEYVSVHSQADGEAAALAQERAELAVDPVGERHELTDIYRRRGLSPALAKEVAEQLMAHDALGAHARDELGFSARSLARPLHAALASAGSFTAGAAIPLMAAVLASSPFVIPATLLASLGSLFGLGALSAKAGGARVVSAAMRVTAWSALAMGVTAGVGALVGRQLGGES
ncbi:MAG TPA: VIT family protein [Steroidobacteraceae bacterium]|nr:VIT family protein [Steroidobacteraceae bacterium]